MMSPSSQLPAACHHQVLSSATFEGTGYQRASSELIALGNQLRGLGVATDINLATIVIAGNQSSGKSSLVEGLAGVSLPRSKGTCTRCPTELRLRQGHLGNSGRIRCEVKLRREFDELGQSLVEIPAEELVISTENRDHIGGCVMVAQEILLNPAEYQVGQAWQHASRLLKKKLDAGPLSAQESKKHQLEFTKNTIVVEIEGAEAELTVVDLPGIVQSHDNETYIHMTKSLVDLWLAHEYSIIVEVITGMDDIENQAIFNMAKAKDAEGKRTLAVITKPDAIAAGTHDMWIALATNARKPLRLGYYVVKNPNQAELEQGLGGKEARMAEARFFQEDAHWSKVTGPAAQRLGTGRLRTALSELLVQRIMEQLPTMLSMATEKLRHVEEDIRSLPPSLSSDLDFELFTMLAKLEQNIQAEVHGQHAGTKKFYQDVQGIYKEFMNEIWNSKPAFVITEELQGEYQTVDQDRVITVMSADAAEYDMLNPGLSDAVALPEVEALLRDHRGNELPMFAPNSAVFALINRFKGRWHRATQNCVDAVASRLKGLVKIHLDDIFGRFHQGFPLISNVVMARLAECEKGTASSLQELIKMEDADTFTINEHYFRDSYEKMLAVLKERLNKHTGRADQVNQVIRRMLDNNITHIAPDVPVEQLHALVPCKQETELKMMAATLAYFKVVIKRVVDEVPLHIRKQLLAEFCRNLPQHTHKVLSSSSPDGVAPLLAEDPAVQQQRIQLLDHKSRLQEAVKILENPHRMLSSGSAKNG